MCNSYTKLHCFVSKSKLKAAEDDTEYDIGVDGEEGV